MIGAKEKVEVGELHKAILQTLLYFDVFKYPITEQEIFENCAVLTNAQEIKQSLSELHTLGYVKKIKDFYMPLWADVDSVERREKANIRAQEMMQTAFNYSKKAAKLPFVKGLCISGSLSKNYFDDQSDIDFFVVTKANRLWICRSLFIIYYKMLPKSKRKYYCLNYFISEADLRIEDKNIFVATELAHLIPTVNYDMYLDILEKNQWYKPAFSNKPPKPNTNCIDTPTSMVKIITEALFPGTFGDRLDDFFMQRTAKRWKRIFAKMDSKDFEIQFRARKHSAKRHEKGHQSKVLVILDQKMKDLEDTLHLKLN